MRFEIPIFDRACGCLPLRYGIIVLGYLRLLFSIAHLALTSYLFNATQVSMLLYHGIVISAQEWFILCLYSVEVIMTIMLLVGCHMIKQRLIRAFYYYALSSTLAAIVMFVVVRDDDRPQYFYVVMYDCTVFFCGLVLQMYLILLIRSELKKLRKTVDCQLFENYNTEAQESICPDDKKTKQTTEVQF